MLITVSGPAGSGKSTLAESLADALSYEHVSGGDIFRSLAEERGMTPLELNKLAEDEDSIDRDLDRRLRTIAAERIRSYIQSNFESHIVSFANEAAQFMQRRIVPQSAAAGEKLENIEIPHGLIVAAVLRGGQAIVPRGDQRLEVGDEVILFVQRDEAAMANLVFPGQESA